MLAGLGRDFVYFRLGQFLALLGGRCSFIALSWWVLEKSGSKEQFSHVMFAFSLVGLVATPLLSPLADRWPRKGCALAADGWALVVVLALFVVVQRDVYLSHAITMLVGAVAIGGAMMNSVTASIVPMLVRRERLVDAYGVVGSLQSMALVLGALFAGAVVKWVGIPRTLLLNALLLVVAFHCTLRIQADTSAPDRTPRGATNAWWPDMVGGARLYASLRLEFWWSVVGGVINACLIPFTMIVLPIFVRDNLRLGVGWYALLTASVATGLLLGSSAITRLLNSRLGPALVTVSGVLMVGSGIVLFPLVRSPYVLMFVAATIGAGMGMHNVNCTAYRVMAVPNRYRARISAWGKWMSQGMAPAGILVFGVIVDRLGASVALLAAGCTVLLAAPVLAWMPGFAALMGAPIEHRENFYETLYPKAFAVALVS